MPTTLWLTTAAFGAITTEAGAKAPRETGGVLMGWHDQERDEIVACVAIGPGPDARHDRHHFHPDGQWTDRQVAHIYDFSGRLVTYIGDWHTHPGGTAMLSATDTATLHKIARNAAARCPRPVMVVAAGGDRTWELRAHLYRASRRPWPNRRRTDPVLHRIWTPNAHEIPPLP